MTPQSVFHLLGPEEDVPDYLSARPVGEQAVHYDATSSAASVAKRTAEQAAAAAAAAAAESVGGECLKTYRPLSEHSNASVQHCVVRNASPSSEVAAYA